MKKQKPEKVVFLIKDGPGKFYWKAELGWVSSKRDATRFKASDAAGVIQRLRDAGQAVFKIELV